MHRGPLFGSISAESWGDWGHLWVRTGASQQHGTTPVGAAVTLRAATRATRRTTNHNHNHHSNKNNKNNNSINNNNNNNNNNDNYENSSKGVQVGSMGMRKSDGVVLQLAQGGLSCTSGTLTMGRSETGESCAP